jgi:hypothetical protein
VGGGGIAGPVQIGEGPPVVPGQNGRDVWARHRGTLEAAVHDALRHVEIIFSYLRSRVNGIDV